MLHTWAGKYLLSVLYMTVDRLQSFLPENKPTFHTFEAGAERGSDFLRLGTRIGEITSNR